MSSKTMMLFMFGISFYIPKTTSSPVFVGSNSKYCNSSLPSSLVCNFSSTHQPVFMMDHSRHKRSASTDHRTMEIKNASVFHLPEGHCYENIRISNTKVIVDNSYQRKWGAKSCSKYHLSLVSSSISHIPSRVSRVDIIGSNIEELALPTSLERASIVQSQVKLFNTTYPLSGFTVVDIFCTNIRNVEAFKIKDNARVHLLSSNLTFRNMSAIEFENNATVIISKSRLFSLEPIVLRVGADVSVTLDENVGKVTFRQSLGEQITQCNDKTAMNDKTSIIPKKIGLCENQVQENCKSECIHLLIYALMIIIIALLVLVLIYRHADSFKQKSKSVCIHVTKYVCTSKKNNREESHLKENNLVEMKENISFETPVKERLPLTSLLLDDNLASPINEGASETYRSENLNENENGVITPSQPCNRSQNSSVKKRTPRTQNGKTASLKLNFENN